MISRRKPSALERQWLIGHLGREIRIRREQAGMTQEMLGKLTHQSPKTISDYETGRKIPSAKFITLTDSVLRADEALMRLWRELTENESATWFEWYLELEAKASVIRMFQGMHIPGMLQTEAYARQIIAKSDSLSRTEDIDAGAAARIARQGLLYKENAPRVTFVLDEAAVRRWPREKGIVAEQIVRMVDVGRLPNVDLHVIPFSHGFHPMVEGFMSVLSFDDADDHGYVEPPGGGLIVTNPPAVSRMRHNFERALGEAASTMESEEFLLSVLKETK